MPTLLLLLGCSFTLCLVLTPLGRALVFHWDLVDHPDGRRKIHGKPIPLAGGMAVFAAVFLTLAIGWWSGGLQSLPGGQGLGLLNLFLACAVMCAVGLADDHGDLRGRHKLFGQCLAVAVVLGSGLVVHKVTLFGSDFDLGILAVPFTAFWLLGAINACNLLDGMDGLLSSVAAIICTMLAVLAFLGGQWLTACVALVVAGALLAFLAYNFPPATTFLGDSGSMLIGLLIGVLSLTCADAGPTVLALLPPLAILTIPILDTTAAIVRRKLRGQSIYTPDRSHLHHCLLRRGFSNRQVLACVALCCLACGLGTLASLHLEQEWLALLPVAGVVATLIVTRFFGCSECCLLANWLARLGTSLWPGRHGETGRQSEVDLEGSAGWTHLLHLLTAIAFELNLKMLRLNVSAPHLREEYHGQWDRCDEVEGAMIWRADIPLALQAHTVGYLLVAGYHDAEPIWEKIACLVKRVEEFQAAAAMCPVASGAPAQIDGKNALNPLELAQRRNDNGYGVLHR